MTTSKSLLHMPFANSLTRTVRKDMKEWSHKSADQINEDVAHAADQLVKKHAKIDPATVGSMDEGQKAKYDTAKQWGDRMVRPFEAGIKYGSRAASYWDRGLSYVVGRGLKNEDEAPAGIVSWQGFRQEGALGMLTRVPALALGSLAGTMVGCVVKKETSTAIKDAFENSAVGVNALVRATTLTFSTFVAAGLGMLTGVGVTGLVSMVALPMLWRARASSERSKAAAAKLPSETVDLALPALSAAHTHAVAAMKALATEGSSDVQMACESLSTQLESAVGMLAKAKAELQVAVKGKNKKTMLRMKQRQGTAQKRVNAQTRYLKLFLAASSDLAQTRDALLDALASNAPANETATKREAYEQSKVAMKSFTDHDCPEAFRDVKPVGDVQGRFDGLRVNFTEALNETAELFLNDAVPSEATLQKLQSHHDGLSAAWQLLHESGVVSSPDLFTAPDAGATRSALDNVSADLKSIENGLQAHADKILGGLEQLTADNLKLAGNKFVTSHTPSDLDDLRAFQMQGVQIAGRAAASIAAKMRSEAKNRPTFEARRAMAFDILKEEGDALLKQFAPKNSKQRAAFIQAGSTLVNEQADLAANLANLNHGPEVNLAHEAAGQALKGALRDALLANPGKLPVHAAQAVSSFIELGKHMDVVA